MKTVLINRTNSCPIKILAGFLLMLAVTAALYAQTADETFSQYTNIKVWLAPTVGGSAEDRAYFDFNLPEEVKGGGYELTNTMYPTPEEAQQASDFYITTFLEYDREFDDNVIVAELYDTRTGALIITTSMGYQTTEEMNDWNLTMIYRLMANAPISKGLTMEESEFAVGEGAVPKKEYPEYKLFLGLRAGYSMRFYMPRSGTYIDPYYLGHTFEAALHVSYHPWQFVGFQAEVLFTRDNAPITYADSDALNATFPEVEYKSFSLMIPLMVKGIFRFSRFTISPLAGLYLTLPLGKMSRLDTVNVPALDENGNPIIDADGKPKVTETKQDMKTSFIAKPPLGFLVGAELGMHLGPGLLFLDLRYSCDFGNTVRDGTSVYLRNMLSLSVGYKFGLLKKEKPSQTETSQ